MACLSGTPGRSARLPGDGHGAPAGCHPGALPAAQAPFPHRCPEAQGPGRGHPSLGSGGFPRLRAGQRAWRPAQGQSPCVPAGRAVGGPEPGQEGRAGGQGLCGFLRGGPGRALGAWAGQLAVEAGFRGSPPGPRPVGSREPPGVPQSRTLGLRRVPGGGVGQRPCPRGGGRALRAAWHPSPLCAPPRSPGEGAVLGAGVRGEPHLAPCSVQGLPGGSGATETSGAPGAARMTRPSCPVGLPPSRERIPPRDPESPGLGPAHASATRVRHPHRCRRPV